MDGVSRNQYNQSVRHRGHLHLPAPGGTATLASGLVLLLLALLPPGIYAIDGNSMFAVSWSLAAHGSVSVPCGVDQAAAHGSACYSIWYPLLSFVAVPFTLAGRGLGGLFGLSQYDVAKETALVVPALAAAFAGVVAGALARRLGASSRGAAAVAVITVFGTEILTYARSFFAETLAALLVVLAVWGAGEAGRRGWVVFGVAASLVVLAKPPLLVVGVAIGLAEAVSSRRLAPLLRRSAASGAGAALYLLYNALRFGDPFQFGGADRFSLRNYVPPKLFEIVGMLVVSPGKGVLWYSPVVAVGVVLLWRRRREPAAASALAVSVSVLLVYVGHPYGGWDWGDRFLAPVVPLLCTPLGTTKGRTRLAVAALAVCGLVSQVPTTVGFYERAYADHTLRGDLTMLTDRWSLRASPLVTSWSAMVAEVRDARHTDVSSLAADARAHPRRTGHRLLSTVALWWWMAPVVGVPRAAGFAVWLLVLGAGALLVARRLRAPPYFVP